MGQTLDRKIPQVLTFVPSVGLMENKSIIAGIAQRLVRLPSKQRMSVRFRLPAQFNKPIAQLGRATLLKCFLGKKINRNYYLAVNPCVIGSNPIRFIENFGK